MKQRCIERKDRNGNNFKCVKNCARTSSKCISFCRLRVFQSVILANRELWFQWTELMLQSAIFYISPQKKKKERKVALAKKNQISNNITFLAIREKERQFNYNKNNAHWWFKKQTKIFLFCPSKKCVKLFKINLQFKRIIFKYVIKRQHLLKWMCFYATLKISFVLVPHNFYVLISEVILTLKTVVMCESFVRNGKTL